MPKDDRPSWTDRFFGLSQPTPDKQKTQAEDTDSRRKAWSLAGAGMELAAGIGLFAAVGYGVDRMLGSLPIGTVVGALLGMAGGIYNLIKAVQRHAGR